MSDDAKMSHTEWYQMMYDQATPDVMAAFWDIEETEEKVSDIIRDLNETIQKRNKLKKIRKYAKGCVNRNFWTSQAEKLRKLVHKIAQDVLKDYTGNEDLEHLFYQDPRWKKIQAEVNKHVDKGGLPPDWKLRDSDFGQLGMNYLDELVKSQGADGRSDSRNEESGSGDEGSDSGRSDSGNESSDSRNVKSDSGNEYFHSADEDTSSRYDSDSDSTIAGAVSVRKMEDLIAKDFGMAVHHANGGTIKYWRGRGKSEGVLVKYKQNGHPIGRVEALGREDLDIDKVPKVVDQARAKEKDDRGNWVWKRRHILEYGIVYYAVDPKYADDPTSILRPMEKGYYPETYMEIKWVDKKWTVESRDGLRKLLDARHPMLADTMIYTRAVALEEPYRRARFGGARRSYPKGQGLQNQHWKNLNAPKQAFYAVPRAVEKEKVIDIIKQQISDDEVQPEQKMNRRSRTRSVKREESESDGTSDDGSDSESDSGSDSGSDRESDSESDSEYLDDDSEESESYNESDLDSERLHAKRKAKVNLRSVKGCKIRKDGLVYLGSDPVARVIEGDVEYMVGYRVGSHGHVWDETGELIGRVGLLSKQRKKAMFSSKSKYHRSSSRKTRSRSLSPSASRRDHKAKSHSKSKYHRSNPRRVRSRSPFLSASHRTHKVKSRSRDGKQAKYQSRKKDDKHSKSRSSKKNSKSRSSKKDDTQSQRSKEKHNTQSKRSKEKHNTQSKRSKEKDDAQSKSRSTKKDDKGKSPEKPTKIGKSQFSPSAGDIVDRSRSEPPSTPNNPPPATPGRSGVTDILKQAGKTLNLIQ